MPRGKGDEEPKYLLELRQCAAILRWVDGDLSVMADVTVDDRAQVAIVVPSTPMSPQLFAFCNFFHPSQSLDRECSITLESASGQSARSEHVQVLSSDPVSGRLVFGCSELWLTTPTDSAAAVPAYEYQVRGLRCFSVSADFDFGHVRIGGSGQIDDRLCGRIIVRPCAELSAEDVDAGVDRVLAILSFATGRRLQSSVRQRHVGDSMESRIWPHGDLSSPMWPPFYFIDLEPIVTTAARTYTKESCSKTGLGVAIQWALAHSAHEAARFLQLMIALEHLIDVAKVRANLIPKNVFEGLQDRFLRVIDEFQATEVGRAYGAECDALRTGTKHLNNPAFKKGIRRILSWYRVPADDLDQHIDALVNLRNMLVHRGIERTAAGNHVLEQEIILRELLTRTFLAILEFDGTYRSWVDGHKGVPFCRTPEPTSD